MANKNEKRTIPNLKSSPNKKSINNKGWDELELGACVFSFDGDIDSSVVSVLPEDRAYEETNSINKYVGDWRVKKPIFNQDHCIDCQNCWIFCPDSAIISRDKKMLGIDYDHCKGCGICADVCPANPKALVMFDEQIKNEDCLNMWPQKTKNG